MFDLLNSWAPHIEPGTWPDADMIPFGKLCLSNYPNYNYPGAKKAEHDSRFTWDEHQTLMSLWAMARSPLMWGGDPAQSSEKSYSYLTNDEVLEILKVSRNNRQLYHKFEGEYVNERIWVADIEGEPGSKYVALFNISDEERTVTMNLELEYLRDYYTVRDLWKKEDIGEAHGTISATLPAHGSALYKLTPRKFGDEPKVWDRSELRIRDPFVVNDDGYTYYMYGSITNEKDGRRVKGVGVYTSTNLQVWHGPRTVFEIPEGFWGEEAVWAPEVHKYNGKYYLFTTLTSKDKLPEKEGRPLQQKRASQIFVADSPFGPFLPFENKPHTPEDWMALDGTLWVEDDTPYMIFCHEWIQTTDGTMELVELTPDLSATVGEPKTLFTATEGNWVRDLGKVGAEYKGKLWEGYVTDGCYLYRTKDDRLLMIWSSFGEQRYAVGMAYSESGLVHGPWKQIQEPLFAADGGHGMIFETFDGKLMLSIHQPNSGAERAHFFELEDVGDRLVIKQELGMGLTD
ncbi:MAG: family 43 glycosylhydrolase, partial [Opitutales bacterium]|nr:family 43 glycosylhydrolase [Opitutales bacterium]